MSLLILKLVAIDNETSWTIQGGTAVKFEYLNGLIYILDYAVPLFCLVLST